MNGLTPTPPKQHHVTPASPKPEAGVSPVSSSVWSSVCGFFFKTTEAQPPKPSTVNEPVALIRAAHLLPAKQEATATPTGDLEETAADVTQAASEHRFIPRSQQVLESIGIMDVASAEKLSPRAAKEILNKPDVKSYLQEGEDLAALKVLTTILLRAHKNEWLEVNREEEQKAFTTQCLGKTAMYTGDIDRAVHFEINGSEIPHDNRINAFKEFCKDDAYGAQLSHAAQQGLAATLNAKLSMSLMQSGLLTGTTSEAEGGVQDIAIAKNANSQLMITVSVKFPISSFSCTAESKPSHIMDLEARLIVMVDEEAFKRGDLSEAIFDNSLEVIPEKPLDSPSQSS